MAKLGIIVKQSSFRAPESNHLTKLSHHGDRPKSDVAWSLVFTQRFPLRILMNLQEFEALRASWPRFYEKEPVLISEGKGRQRAEQLISHWMINTHHMVKMIPPCLPAREADTSCMKCTVYFLVGWYQFRIKCFTSDKELTNDLLPQWCSNKYIVIWKLERKCASQRYNKYTICLESPLMKWTLKVLLAVLLLKKKILVRKKEALKNSVLSVNILLTCNTLRTQLRRPESSVKQKLIPSSHHRRWN